MYLVSTIQHKPLDKFRISYYSQVHADGSACLQSQSDPHTSLFLGVAGRAILFVGIIHCVTRVNANSAKLVIEWHRGTQSVAFRLAQAQANVAKGLVASTLATNTVTTLPQAPSGESRLIEVRTSLPSSRLCPFPKPRLEPLHT